MEDINQLKFIAENLFSLSAELLKLVDQDETKRQKFLEEIKKIPKGK